MTLPLVLGAVFFAIAIMGWAISQTLASRSAATVSGRIASFVEKVEKTTRVGKHVEQAHPEEKKYDFWSELDQLIEKRTFVQKMILEFQKADLKLRYSEYVGMYFLVTFVPGIIGYLIDIKIIRSCIINILMILDRWANIIVQRDIPGLRRNVDRAERL